MSRTFKTASLGYGFGALKNNADTLRGFVNSNPELLAQIGGPKALDSYIKQQQQAMFHNPETGGDYQFSPETQNIDKLLQGYQMNSVGYDGMKNGRQKAIVKDGETQFKGDPYSYNAAKDNLETVLRGGALIAGTGALGAMANPGLMGGFGGGAAGGAQGAAQGAGIMEGGGLINGAFANTAAGAGTLAPGGVAGLIPTGAQLGAMGGGQMLAGAAGAAGGLLGGGVGAGAGGFGATLANGMKKAGGGLLNAAKNNPRLAGAALGGLLGGTGGGSGGSGGSGGQAYNGPMPTIERGNWSPTAQAQMMEVPQFGGLLPKTGNANSGLWRYGR